MENKVPQAFKAFMVVIILIVILAFGYERGYKYGYTEAYEDNKNNRIEEKTKKLFPALWIKYNAPIKEKTE